MEKKFTPGPKNETTHRDRNILSAIFTAACLVMLVWDIYELLRAKVFIEIAFMSLFAVILVFMTWICSGNIVAVIAKALGQTQEPTNQQTSNNTEKIWQRIF